MNDITMIVSTMNGYYSIVAYSDNPQGTVEECIEDYGLLLDDWPDTIALESGRIYVIAAHVDNLADFRVEDWEPNFVCEVAEVCTHEKFAESLLSAITSGKLKLS